MSDSMDGIWSAQKNVYIVGAQCTGKTTLVNAIEESIKRGGGWTNEEHVQQPFIIREVARTVLKEKCFTREDLTNSPFRALELQQHILEGQFKVEKAASSNAGSAWYICDRSGLDPIVYAQQFAGAKAAEEMLASSIWAELEVKMKAGIVILCEAGCTWLIDDGTRLMPTGLEDWMKVDRGFRKLLDARGIAFSVIPKDLVSLSERVEFVKNAMKFKDIGIA